MSPNSIQPPGRRCLLLVSGSALAFVLGQEARARQVEKGVPKDFGGGGGSYFLAEASSLSGFDMVGRKHEAWM